MHAPELHLIEGVLEGGPLLARALARVAPLLAERAPVVEEGEARRQRLVELVAVRARQPGATHTAQRVSSRHPAGSGTVSRAVPCGVALVHGVGGALWCGPVGNRSVCARRSTAARDSSCSPLGSGCSGVIHAWETCATHGAQSQQCT